MRLEWDFPMDCSTQLNQQLLQATEASDHRVVPFKNHVWALHPAPNQTNCFCGQLEASASDMEDPFKTCENNIWAWHPIIFCRIATDSELRHAPIKVEWLYQGTVWVAWAVKDGSELSSIFLKKTTRVTNTLAYLIWHINWSAGTQSLVECHALSLENWPEVSEIYA